MAFPKNSVLGAIFLSAPSAPPFKKGKFDFYCRLAVSDHFGARRGGRTLQKGVFLPSKHLLSALYDTHPSKNPCKNPCPHLNPLKAPSKIEKTQTGFLTNGVFAPCRKQGVLTKMAKMTNVCFVHKNKGFAPPAPEKDENDENGACHACTGPVCQKPCLHVPDKNPSKKHFLFKEPS